eukprot:165328_1
MTALLPSRHKSTKKFFWAITSQTECFICGYFRIFLDNSTMNQFPESIKLLVAKFSSDVFIDSKILKFNEIDLFLSLLSNQWNNKKLFLNLIHRGSDNNFDINELFDTLNDNECNEYIIILETNHGSVFGIYNKFDASKKSSSSIVDRITGHKGFEFVLRAKHLYLPKIYPSNSSVSYLNRYIGVNIGDITSKNCSIKFCNNPQLNDNNLCIGIAGFNANKLCGGFSSTRYMTYQAFKFRVIDYELFFLPC